jgi:hypothetical protein
VQNGEANGNLPAQRIHNLEQEDGSIVKVAISVRKIGTVEVMDRAVIGQTIGFRFEKERPPKMAGQFPTKCIEVYLVKMKAPPVATPEDVESLPF